MALIISILLFYPYLYILSVLTEGDLIMRKRLTALLLKNSEILKQNTLDVAKESERGIVDMETLRATNESLISTLDEVMRIQQEGRQKRQEAEAEMSRMENELKAKFLQISG